jgi:hypothetical protein
MDSNDLNSHTMAASLEYRQLVQDETTFPVWNKAAASEFVRMAQVGVVGGGGGPAPPPPPRRIQHNLLYPTPSNHKGGNCYLWPFCGGHPSQQN